jgi:hypothetical protein
MYTNSYEKGKKTKNTSMANKISASKYISSQQKDKRSTGEGNKWRSGAVRIPTATSSFPRL